MVRIHEIEETYTDTYVSVDGLSDTTSGSELSTDMYVSVGNKCLRNIKIDSRLSTDTYMSGG